MIDDTKIKQYPREASPKQMADLLEKLERDREMTGSDGRYDEPKPKKRVVEPIKIPEILSVPRVQPIKQTEIQESYNTEPGLSKRFTQDKMREAQISKQLDQELADESDREDTLNKRGTKYI